MNNKYTDLEINEADEEKSLTSAPQPQKKSNKEYCWWCLILCPIMLAIGTCIGLVIVILDQYHIKENMKHKEEFNNIWIILSFIGIFICGCPLVCHSIQLLLGYWCHPGDKN